MVSSDLKELIEQYLTLTIWFLVHDEDKDISSEQFEAVLKEIGNVEEKLLLAGVRETAITKLLDFSEQQLKTPISRHTENAQLRLCKIIFGQAAHWADDFKNS